MGGLLDAAREYLARGWSVIPIRNDGDKKPPACKWTAYQTRLATEAEVGRMFRLPGLTGLAVILGEVSGDLWSRDFDMAEAFPRWAGAFPDVARILPRVVTARGVHLYGRWPGVTFANMDDGELRAGSGHYNLVPPAKHPSGTIYIWATSPPATVPQLDPATVGLDKTWGGVTQGTQGTQGSQELSGVEEERKLTERTGSVPLDLLREWIPNGPGQNHEALFELARRVRGLEVQTGQTYCMAALRAAIKTWCELNPHLGDGQTEADYLEEFMEAYSDVRVPYGTPGTLDLAWEAAQTAAPIPEATQYGEAFGLLAAWCRELQRTAGGRAFYLGSRTVATRFGLAAPLQGWRRLKLLCRLGVLELVEAGDRRRASTFRYRLPLEPPHKG